MIDWLSGEGVRVYELPDVGRTIVYRGCEIVAERSRFVIWYLAISGRQGRVGWAESVVDAKRKIDTAWEWEDWS